MDLNHLKELIQKIAISEGFVEIGYLNTNQAKFPGWLTNWLKNNYHGNMNWMQNHRTIRENPCTIIDSGKSIISLLYPYKTSSPKHWNHKHMISNYAWGKDYHIVIKKKLKRIYQNIQNQFPDFSGRYFVDSAPIPEKIVAAASGLGWIGKNSMLINKKYGSYVFIAELVCNQNFASTDLIKPGCGNCDKCIKICPGKAIVDNATIDSNKCISYLTIEKREEFTVEEQKIIQYQLFGCDICQQVCPWNKKTTDSEIPDYNCFDRWKDLTPQKMLRISEAEFEDMKINSSLKRAGLDHLKRNAKAILNQQSGLID
ncbi:MAG: tRNA epoxyqueuosine(34) reductase QueG [Deltaproteobacteria bacterium]|jgi:epoxyqueuosine reductase|nr:tRNA epoxyqueuosine(34) reductase QueG [Deltaproteobacteria bacterium]